MDKYLRNNTLVKGLAFVLALMLWLIVNMDEQPNSTLRQQFEQRTLDDVRVEVIYDEERYALKDENVTVQVLLSGNSALLNLNQLRSDPYRIYADLTGYEAGRHRVELQHEGFPSALEVEIIPSHVYLELEEKIARAFDVEIELTGQAREGYTVHTPVVYPPEVYVIAPGSVMEQVARVVGYVDLDGADERIVQEVELLVYDMDGNERDVELSQGTVEVEIPIQSPSTQVPIQLELVNELPEGLILESYELSHQQVEVHAPLHILEKIELITLSLDLETITESKTIRMDIPKDGDWIAVDPSFVEVDVTVSRADVRTFSNVPLTFGELPDGYAVEVLEPENGLLSVDIQGHPDLLDQLTLQDIVAILELSETEVGEHTMHVAIQVPESFDVLSEIEAVVNITRVSDAESDGDEQEQNEGE